MKKGQESTEATRPPKSKQYDTADGKKPTVWQAIKHVFLWYEGMEPVERSLVRKLDYAILSFCCLNFFLKYLDQSNVNSAFVSGMKEELSLYGNELNWFTFAFNIGYMLFQVPFLLLLSRPGIARWIFPIVEVFWGVLTFCQSRVTHPEHLYAIRFLLGSLEAISYSGANFVLGSWYRGPELFKRAAVFMISNGLGKMFSGYLQSAAYTNLNGVSGMTGWRWLFIIDGVITLPIALLGFIIFPGIPASGKPWFLKSEEYDLALARLAESGVAAPKKISFASVKRILSRWHIYLCVLIYILFLGQTLGVGTMNLWLKYENEHGGHKWTVPEINNIPTAIEAVNIVSTWLVGSLAGSFNYWYMFVGVQGVAFFATLCLAIWYIPDGLKMFCYIINGIMNSGNPILFSWINIITRRDMEERAMVLGTTMTFGWAFAAWIPLVAWQVIEAPQFPKGFPTAVAMIVVSTALFLFGGVLQRREDARLADQDEAAGPSESVETGSISKQSVSHVEGGRDQKLAHVEQAEVEEVAEMRTVTNQPSATLP